MSEVVAVTFDNQNLPDDEPRYQGKLDANGLKNGHGVQIWPDGSRYEGDWNDDKANGSGTFTHANGEIYQGMWKDDMAHGQGTFSGAISTYVGQWVDDLQDGEGHETFKDGSKY